jgi:hypothetical protein
MVAMEVLSPSVVDAEERPPQGATGGASAVAVAVAAALRARSRGRSSGVAASLSADPSVLEQGRPPWLRAELPLLRQPPAEVRAGVDELEVDLTDLGATTSSRWTSRCRRTSRLEPWPPPLPLALLRRADFSSRAGPATPPPLPSSAGGGSRQLIFSSSPSCCWRGATTASVGPANRPSCASASPGYEGGSGAV